MSLVHPLVFTPRIAKDLWQALTRRLVNSFKRDVLTEETFIAHCCAPHPEPSFTWFDRYRGVTYCYDLRTNQVQADPLSESHLREVEETNRLLAMFLPLRFLDPAFDWSKEWFEAAQRNDRTAMRLCEEQGFDPKTQLQPADLPGLWFSAANGGDVEMLRFLLAQGCDVNTRDERGHTALAYVTDPYAPSFDAVRLLVEAGIVLEDVQAIIDFNPTEAAGKWEAMEGHAISAYLKEKVAEADAKRPVV